jgi:peptide chain release factor 2
MALFEEEATKIETCLSRLDDLRNALNVEKVQADIAQLETEMAVQGFWDDPDAAQGVVQKMKQLKNTIEAPQALHAELEDAQVLIEMAREEGDESMSDEIAGTAEQMEEKLLEVELSCMLNDPRDAKNAIVSIHPGAGGTESCDWAGMLYRMLIRFCERREFKVDILEHQDGEEAGIKSVSFQVSGPLAYGYLKSEAGVHRLVRISPFDAQSRRHTSFAAVEVLTEIDDNIEIELRDEDIRMDVFRASGAGGQHINKTSSAVRLTHAPSGIVVSCQMGRSQHKNKEVAIKMLKAKLYDIEMQKKQEELDAQRDGHQDVAWGNQIRSYVLHPYQMIKDHRTNVETGNVDKVLDGYLEPFTEAYLKWKLEQKRN